MDRSVERRRFLKSAAFTGAMGFAAGKIGLAQQVGELESGTQDPFFRIRQLDLLTACALNKMQRFYSDLLEFRILEASADTLSVQAGMTVINFRRADFGQPFYHFAFNIPENKITKARNWVKERTELMETPAHMIDADYPADVRHFRRWNAHSIFFWDPAGNILECIARHTMNNGSDGAFLSRDILYVSEIGLVAEGVPDYAENLKSQFQMSTYQQSSEHFHAVGDETGLLIVFKKGRLAGGSARRPQHWNVFPTGVAINHQIVHEQPGLPYRIEG